MERVGESVGKITEPATKPDGVFYRYEDHAGFFRRILIDLIDVTIAFALSITCVSLARAAFTSGSEGRFYAFLFSWFGVWYIYFVLLKRSRLRTAGYWIGGVKIVNLRGERPGLFWMTFRLGFAVFGPLNVVVDLVWIGNDDYRQALRDKFARTYVIRRNATPAGRGPIHYEYYTLLGMSLIFPEVVTDRSPIAQLAASADAT